MRIWFAVTLTALTTTLTGATPLTAQQLAVNSSIRPEIRPSDLVTPDLQPTQISATSQPGFERWLQGFRKRALAQGIRAQVFDAAFRGVTYDASIIARDRNQSEFTKQIWEYLDSAVSNARVKNGRASVAKHTAVLSRIEAKYGVEKEIVAAIWGLETSYGAFFGDTNTIQALATLAYDPRRSAFFEQQTLDALRILQAGDISKLQGSWAGAMGHTQFMPTSYIAHAQDFNRDGRRDIWGKDPTDALASTAAYLQHNGWKKGQPWGIEVILPKGFDYANSTERVKKPVSYWNRQGVRLVNGKQIPNHGRSSILLPAGHRGAAFVIFDNFQVLETYNTADAYVIGVGHLADRIAGAGAIRGNWPRGDKPLSFTEKKEMQKRLLAKGFDPAGLDGIIGPRTIAAVQAFQASVGMVPDGYVSKEVLGRLR